MKFLIVLLISISANAEGIDMYQSFKTNKDNVDKGELVRIYGTKLLHRSKKYDLFKTVNGPALLQGGDSYNSGVDGYEQRKNPYDFVYLLGKPKGNAKAFNPDSGETNLMPVFEITHYCTSSQFTSCKKFK